MVKVYVRTFITREVVKEIEVGTPSPRNHERFMLGLLRNMDQSRYFVDDSEVTFAAEPGVPGREEQ